MSLMEDRLKDALNNAKSTKGVDADKIWNAVETDLDSSNGGAGINWARGGVLLAVIISSFLIGRYSLTMDDTIEKSNTTINSQLVITNEESIESKSSINNEIDKTDNTSVQRHFNSNNHLKKNNVPENHSFTNEFKADAITQDKTSVLTDSNNFNEHSISGEKFANNFEGKMDGKKEVKRESNPNRMDVLREDMESKSRKVSKDDSSSLMTEKNAVAFISGANIKKETHSEGLSSYPKKIQKNVLSRVDEMEKPLENLVPDFMEKIGLRNNKHEVNLIQEKRNITRSTLYSNNTLPIELSWHIGLNKQFNAFKNSDNKEFKENIDEAITQKFGMTRGGYLRYFLNENISLASGFESVKINAEFEYENEEMKNIILNDQLISFSVTPQGDTINPVYGNSEQLVIEKRHVRHYNQYKLISIPFEIGYTQNLSGFNLGASLGLSYNLFRKQEGRSITEVGEFVLFNESTTTGLFPYKKDFLAINLNPFIDIPVNNALKFKIMPSFKFQYNGESPLYALKQQSILISLNGGLAYRF